MLVRMSGLGLGLDQNSDLTKPVPLLIKLIERVLDTASVRNCMTELWVGLCLS